MHSQLATKIAAHKFLTEKMAFENANVSMVDYLLAGAMRVSATDELDGHPQLWLGEGGGGAARGIGSARSLSIS